MIIIFILLLTTVFAKQDNYIDRLPNAEDFLNEIARKMMAINDYVDQIKENNGKENSESLREFKDNNTHINQENAMSRDLAVKPLKFNNEENTFNGSEGLVKENNKTDKNDVMDNSNVFFITKNKGNVTYGTSYVPTVLTSNGHLKLSGRATEENITTTKIYPPLTKSLFYKTAVTNKKPETIKLVENITKLDMDDANNYLDKTKRELNKEEDPVITENNDMADNKNLKHYQVYEIPWPNKPENQPYFRNPEPIDDPRFKVPLFKYLLKNAYYNTEKSLKSNNNKNTLYDFESVANGTNTEKKRMSDFWWVVSISKFLKLLKNKDKNNNFITYNNYTSIEKASHSLNDGLKTHIRTVRDIFKNKPYYHTNEYKKTLDEYEKTSPIFRARYDCLPDIDIDYYFGRMNRKYKKCKNLMAHHSHNHKKSNKKRHKSHFLKNLGHHYNNIGKHINLIFKNQKQAKLKKKKHKYKKNKGKSDLLTEKHDIYNEKIEDTNVKSMNREFDVNIETYMKVLKDIILQDNKALKQYDWLKTTVQIQQALSMMIQIIKQMKESRLIHSEDIEFLKHAVFINNLSSDIKKTSDLEKELKNFYTDETRNIKQEIDKTVEVNNLINQKRINLRTLLPDLTVKDELSVLNDFLLEVQDGLFDLHEALMNIAKVTRFDNQHWYDNLKELYLTLDEKNLREILLHISFARLLDLIENGRQNGLQDDFESYVKQNPKESKRIVEEVVFVCKILDDIKSNVN